MSLKLNSEWEGYIKYSCLTRVNTSRRTLAENVNIKRRARAYQEHRR